MVKICHYEFTLQYFQVSSKGHVLFARVLKYGNSEEQEHAVQALRAHTCPQSCKVIQVIVICQTRV